MPRRLLSVLALATALALPAAAAEGPVLAHLASFKVKANADHAWQTLADRYASILYFRPELKMVDLTAKGQFYRIYADGDEALVRLLCHSLTQRRMYCALHDRATLEPERRLR